MVVAAVRWVELSATKRVYGWRIEIVEGFQRRNRRSRDCGGSSRFAGSEAWDFWRVASRKVAFGSAPTSS